MPAATAINEPLIRDVITRAVTNAGKAMTGREPHVSPDTEPLIGKLIPNSDRPQIVGTVGFIGENNELTPCATKF